MTVHGVSVVIPAYNQAHYLGAAIESALSQTCPPAEVIVVNDGSTDDTAGVCAEFGARIRYLVQPNGGPSAAKNLGLRNRDRGNHVLLLDADDLLEQGWISAALVALQERSDHWAGILYGDYVLFDEGGQYERKVRPRGASRERLLHDNVFLTSGTLVTRPCLERVPHFRSEVDTCEEWDFWLRAALRGVQFSHLDHVAFRHREHSESASKSLTKALHRRLHFLENWLGSPELTEREHSQLRLEIGRTYMRLRRAAYAAEGDTEPLLRRAFEADPNLIRDPYLMIYGAVNVAPFFRAKKSRADDSHSIATLHTELLELLQETPSMKAESIARRLEAQLHIALAASATLNRRFLGALVHGARSIVKDWTLGRQLLSGEFSVRGEMRRAAWAI